MAGCRIYPLADILKWTLYGQWMNFLYKKVFPGLVGWAYNVLKNLLPRFDKGAPTWFTCGWAWAALWDDNLTDCATYRRKCRPNTAFALYYKKVAKERFEDYIEHAAEDVANPLVALIWFALGNKPAAQATFATWIEGIPQTIEDWATARYDTVRLWYNNQRKDLEDKVEDIGDWFDDVASWVEDFWSDPPGTVLEMFHFTYTDWYNLWVRLPAKLLWWPKPSRGKWMFLWRDPKGAVLGWFGITTAGWDNFWDDPLLAILKWLNVQRDKWDAFWDDPLQWICDKWDIDKQEVHDFFDDPLMWLYDRVEEELIRRW